MKFYQTLRTFGFMQAIEGMVVGREVALINFEGGLLYLIQVLVLAGREL